jgi:hypothetical protein
LDVRDHGLEGIFAGLLDVVLGSELHLEPKNTCSHCNQNRNARPKGKVQGQLKIEDWDAWPGVQQL